MANSKKRGALTTFVATKWKTPNITPVITTTNCNNHANCCQHNTTFNKQYRANSCSTHISSMSCEGGRGFDSSCPEPRHRHNSGIISFITNSITTITTTAAAIATATATATISNSSTLGNIWNRGSPLPSSTVADFRVNSATSSATKVATGSRNAQSNGDTTTTTTTSSSTFDSMTKPTTIVIASESETASPTSRGMTFPTFGPSTVSTTITAPSPSTSSSTTTKTPSSSSSSSCGRRQNFVATIPLKWYFFFWHFFCILAPCLSLSMTEVRIPKHIMRYENAALGCKFDLDGESLYSVKWYKDGFEFYRYVPRDMPPGQVFPLPGVDVDLQNSTDNVVALRRVTLQSTGRYRCEVSGEAPSFQTVSGHEDMIVVVTPSAGPQITGGKPRYQIGDLVSVNCTSAPSKPICHLSWLINGIHANRSFLRYYEPRIVGREGLEEATLGLEFRVRG